MIEICYTKSASGMDSCFDFLFRLEDYIPEDYLEQDRAELNFFLHILRENGMYADEEGHEHPIIWSTHYDCTYNEIPFTMVYDEDEDMVSFAVAKEHISRKCEIAQHIKQLIERNRKKNPSMKEIG